MAAVAAVISSNESSAPNVVLQQPSSSSLEVPGSPSSPQSTHKPRQRSSSSHTPAATYSSRCPRTSSRIVTVVAFFVVCAAIGVADFAAFGSDTADAAPGGGILVALVCSVREAWNKIDIGTELTILACFIAFFFGMQTQVQRAKTAGGKATFAKTTSSKGKALSRPLRSAVDDASGQPAAPPASSSRRSPASWKLNQALETAVRVGDAAQALRLISEVEDAGEVPHERCYHIGLRACAKAGHVQEAQVLVKRMQSLGVAPTLMSYNVLLDACAKAGKVEACEQWLQAIKDNGLQPNVVSYATAIYGRARRGDVQGAVAWLETMLQVGIEPDAVSYNSVIHACGVKGKVTQAERWLREMQSKDLECSVATFTAVIDACAKSGNVAAAEGWIEAMTSAGVQPNVVTFSAMVDACATKGNLPRAEYWHNRMVEVGIKPNAHSFSTVIKACQTLASFAGAEAAEVWLDRCEEAGFSSDLVVYNTAIDACGKAGDTERAMRIFSRMRSRGLKPLIKAYAALARPFAYRGDWVKIESIAQIMMEDCVEPNEYFLYAQLLAYAVARPRQPDRAEDCFREAVRARISASDHVISVLARSVGRIRCSELMGELCGGRELPPVPPRGGRGGGRGRSVA